MAALAVLNPIPQFFELDGDPLDDGKLYFGAANQNPITSPIQVYWDANELTPAAQPIRTKNGYPVRAGSPAIVYTSVDYSLLVLDKRGRTVFYAANSADFGNAGALQAMINQFIANLANTGSASMGAGYVGLNATLNYAAGTVGAHLVDDVSVQDFPWLAKGDGATDDTGAIQAAVTWCRANNKRLRFPRPSNYYLVSSTIVLSSDTLTPVNIIGEDPQWYGNETVTVRGDFDGPIFQANGTAISYCVAPYIGNLTIINRNGGANACCVRADYSGGLRMDWCRMQHRNFGVYSSAEMISPVFWEVCIDSDAGAPNGTGEAGFKLGARNTKIYGGRVYAQKVAFDYSGDILFVSGTNAEFCQVIFRHGPLASALFSGCHFETSQVLLTNATTIPISFAGAWVDNASLGTGISGSVNFQNCTVFFTGGVYGTRSNMVVIKAGPGFGYRLQMDGCSVAVYANSIVGNSFTPGATVGLPSGTKVRTNDTDQITVVVPPSDGFSNFDIEGPGARPYTDKQRINDLQFGRLVNIPAMANGAFVDILTGFGPNANAIYELSWKAQSAGYEYAAVQKSAQSLNTLAFGSRLEAIGAGSAGAHWTVTWVPGTGALRLTNASGVLQNVSYNFQILHRF